MVALALVLALVLVRALLALPVVRARRRCDLDLCDSCSVHCRCPCRRCHCFFLLLLFVVIVDEMSGYHFLLLYPTKLLALSKITGAITLEQGFSERYGEMRGMITDVNPPSEMYPLIWVFSNK